MHARMRPSDGIGHYRPARHATHSFTPPVQRGRAHTHRRWRADNTDTHDVEASDYVSREKLSTNNAIRHPSLSVVVVLVVVVLDLLAGGKSGRLILDGSLVALLPGGNKATCADFKCRYRERNPREFRVSCAKVETRCLMKRPTIMHWVLLRHAL